MLVVTVVVSSVVVASSLMASILVTTTSAMMRRPASMMSHVMFTPGSTPTPSSATPIVAIAFAFGNVNSERTVFKKCAVQLESLFQRVLVVKLDVAEALELVGLLVTNESNGANAEVLKHVVDIALNNPIRQVANIGCEGWLVRDGSVPATAAAIVAIASSGKFKIRFKLAAMISMMPAELGTYRYPPSL